MDRRSPVQRTDRNRGMAGVSERVAGSTEVKGKWGEMSRARNLKPKFFKNEQLAELPFEYRMLFQGLWCEADRAGRLEDRPKRIKAEIFPYDNVDVEDGLQRLQSSGFIKRYSVGQSKFIQVLTFNQHQNPHCKEPASTIPAPCEHSAGTVQEPVEHSSGPADSLFPQPSTPNIESTIVDLSPAAPEDDGQDDGDEAGDLLAVAPCPVKRIVALYHKSLPELPPVREFPEQSAKCLRARWRSLPERQTLEWWQGFFDFVRTCPYLMGEVNAWQADLGWLVRPTNFAKVLNGNYQRREA